MSLFDSIGKGMMDKLGASGGQGNLVGAVAALINSPSVGGLSGLTQLFNQRGEGDTAASWVSNEENRPISPDKVQDVLGEERVQQVADAAGVSQEDASHGIATILPQLVNQLTPQGKLDDQHASGMLSQLVQKFSKH